MLQAQPVLGSDADRLREIIAHKDRILATHVRELLAIRNLLGAHTDETALASVKRALAAQVKA